jgi:glycosyltransferase involved in cell wall biosynthesis
MNIQRVSIGMPVYNASAYLRTALDAVLAQTFADFELIIADNASSDESASICEEYARRDPRIRLYRNAVNIGANGNFTYTLSLARHPYFMWTSSNDYIEPTYIEKAVAVLDARPDVVLCCSVPRYFAGDPTHFRDVADPMDIQMESPIERFSALLDRITINNAMHGLIRTDALRATMPLESYYSSDNVMVAQLSLAGKFVQIPEPLFYRRFEQAAATELMTTEELRHFYMPGRRSPLRFQVWRLQAGLWALLARAHLRLTDRLRLGLRLIRYTYWDGPKLVRDILEALRLAAPASR